MKNKVVTWGTNAQNERVLIALELQEESNKILLYTIPEAAATEEFVNELTTTWRDDKGEVTFPEGHTVVEREMSVTESILPDDLTAERPEIITRAQTEWQFIVLANRLHRAYQAELAEFKEKIASLEKYDKGIFDSLKAFWDKVNNQSRDRTIYKRHADSLRDEINVLFNDLKKVRNRVEEEFQEVSKKVYDELNEKLVAIEEKIEKGGAKFGAMMDELKALQGRYHQSKMSNEHRNQLWTRLDGAFKKLKGTPPGGGSGEGGDPAERHNKRLQGLNDALRRMESSLKRDEEELDYQRKRVASTDGQLEAQIRQAKIKMIEERISSKRASVADMTKIKSDIERQIATAKERADKRQKLDAARETAKSEIAAVTNRVADAPVENEGNVPATQSVMDALTSVLGESFEDVVDTVKAVASVVGEKAEIAINEALEKAGDVVDSLTKDKEEAPAAPAAEPEVVAAEEADPAPAAEEAPATEEAPAAEDKPADDDTAKA